MDFIMQEDGKSKHFVDIIHEWFLSWSPLPPLLLSLHSHAQERAIPRFSPFSHIAFSSSSSSSKCVRGAFNLSLTPDSKAA